MSRRKAGDAAFAIFRPGKFMESKAAERQAKQDRKDAERFRQESMDMAGQFNWEPDYVSDIMPNYQRTQSPLARSYLESMLTGANPSNISSTRLGAGRLKAGAQAGFDQQFGGWDSLLERQRAAEKAMPWAPGKFSAPAVQKLPPRQQPQEPAYMGAVRADPNGQTPEGSAALQEMWGFGPDADYWRKLEEATGKRIDRADRTARRG